MTMKFTFESERARNRYRQPLLCRIDVAVETGFAESGESDDFEQPGFGGEDNL